MMLPRLVDGILDPIIGHWSDELRTRWGRRKPLILGGAFIGAPFLAALWWASPSWSPMAQTLILGIGVMGLYICYGTYTMAWNAMGYELSDDYHERSRVQAVQGFSGFTLLMAILFPLTEEKMKDVRLKLDELHLAKAALGEPTDEVAEQLRN